MLHTSCRWAASHAASIASLRDVHERVDHSSNVQRNDTRLDAHLADQMLELIVNAFGFIDDQQPLPQHCRLMWLHLDACLPCEFLLDPL